MRSISLFVTVFITVLTTTLNAQKLTEEEIRKIAATAGEPELVMQTSTLTQEGYLYYASILVDRLMEINPTSSNYNYRKGYLLLEVYRDYLTAKNHFVIAVQDVDNNYDMYSHRETSAPPDAYFHLASCYHLEEDINKAEENYKLFQSFSNKKSELLAVTELRLKQCEQARVLMGSPVNVFLKNIGPEINTQYPEYSPVVSLDGSSLYFTSKRPWANNETERFRDLGINQYPEDVYVSYLDFDSTWTEPIRLDFCEPKRNEASISVSSDERQIYLYEDTTGNGDIYTTDFYHAKFQEIQPLDIEGVNTNDWETHCMMSHNKQRFFFVSDRKGGYGGRDIYVMERKKNGKWTNPKNLGPGINSEYDEDSPFIAIDNKTLYFSSNGPKSIGGFDIFKSEMTEDSTWTESMNLGYPFNSTNDDIFYTTTLDGKRGYMTSYRLDGKGEKDIYEIYNDYLGVKDVAILKGLIKTVDNKPIPEDFAINVRLVCIDCDDNTDSRFVYPRLRDGVFMTSLKPCKTYKLEYTNLTDSVMMHEDGFTTFCDTANQEIYRELLLDVDKRIIIIPQDTIEVPEVIVSSYPNLEFMHYFAYNKNKLDVKKGELKDFVDKVAEQLKAGREKITINVYSSASNVPTKTYKTNENLTQVRADNMKYDLISYFQSIPELKDKVNVVVVTAVVQGPPYDKDAADKEKYFPYQYVGLKTE
jgi:Tol biopolymer transport system component